MFKDVGRAVWRAPLHILGSIPVAAVSLIIPPLGQKYVNWRIGAEQADEATGRDSPEKSQVDLYTQTALVKAVLKVWGK
jgi:hypothetical protein